MRILVTGACGQLGRYVVQQARQRGHLVIASDHRGRCDVQMDITDRQQIYSVLLATSPDAVIHCAAWTRVDLAQSNPEAVYRINAFGSADLAAACKSVNCKIIYISTDYVFDGAGSLPWDEDCRDFAPLNVYGKSKLEGERFVSEIWQKHYIVRTSWVFGCEGQNFVKTMLRLGLQGRPLDVVADQWGRPTYAKDLARLLIDMAQTDQYGCYHVTNEGDHVSRYDLVRGMFRIAGIDTPVNKVTTGEFGGDGAPRPLNGRLSTKKLVEKGFQPLPDWQDGLRRFMEELNNG